MSNCCRNSVLFLLECGYQQSFMSTKVLVAAATKVEQWRRKCLNQCFACLSRGFPQQQRPSLLFFQWLNYEIYFERDVTVQYSCWMDLSAPQYICPSLVPAQHRDYLELARPALFFSHPMALGGHQDQNEYSCKSPAAAAAALLYSNGLLWLQKTSRNPSTKVIIAYGHFSDNGTRCSTTSWTTMQNRKRLE